MASPSPSTTCEEGYSAYRETTAIADSPFPLKPSLLSELSRITLPLLRPLGAPIAAPEVAQISALARHCNHKLGASDVHVEAALGLASTSNVVIT